MQEIPKHPREKYRPYSAYMKTFRLTAPSEKPMSTNEPIVSLEQHESISNEILSPQMSTPVNSSASPVEINILTTINMTINNFFQQFLR